MQQPLVLRPPQGRIWTRGSAQSGWRASAPRSRPSSDHPSSVHHAVHRVVDRSELQMSTIRNLLMAWVLTLPVSILLSGFLYMILSQIL